MSQSNLKYVSVLYVEDDAMIREELVELLEEMCAAFYVAQDGAEGLELFRKYSPDVVLSDIRMPNMDGLSMSKLILEQAPLTPIVIASAFNDSDYMLEAIRLGIQYYLLKPTNITDLFSVLEKASERVVNAKRLEKNEKLLNQYKEAIDKSAIVSKTDINGTITYANEAFCTISGYTLEELMGKSHNIIRHPENPDSVYKAMWSTILAKKAWHGILKNRNKQGRDYIVETTIIPSLNKKDEIEEFISIRQDVTQRELDKLHLEQRLQTSSRTLAEKQQFIFEYEKALKQSTLFCRTTKEGEITMASDALIKLLGIDEKRVLGSSYFHFVDKSDIKKLDKEVREAVALHTIWQGLVKHKNSEGSELYLNSSFIPIMDIMGKVDEVFCFYTDLTEQVNLNRDIIATQREVISTMGAIGETRSQETGDHVKRVAEYSKLLALKYGLSEQESEEIKMASPMHDIGKVGIPDNILNKPAALTEEEFEIMKTHATLGYEMLKGSRQPLLETASIIALTHHEKWDGSGYPKGIKGEDIHIYGRITAIADVFDALGHDRVYKKAWPLEKILELFREGKGRHFDPQLIELFLENLEDFLAIKELFDGKERL